MKEARPCVAGFFDLYFYFTGLGEIVGQEKAGRRKWGWGVALGLGGG
jgi:hypothetical protein